MNPAYRRILTFERSMLIESVEWTEKFKRGLVDEQLLTETEITKLEGIDEDERIGDTLKKIAHNKSAGAFYRFCRLLERTVRRDVSDVLYHDRANIVWDFKRQESFQSAAEFTEQVIQGLLEPSRDSDDPYIQSARVKEACKRLRALTAHLQGSQAEKQRFRRKMQQLMTESTSEGERVEAKNDDEQDFVDFKALQDRDNELRRSLIQLAEENASILHDQVCHLQKELESARLDRQSCSSEALGQEASQHTQREQMARMEELIKKQDRELAVFTFSQRRSKRDYVPMKKKDVERILGDLKPYMTRYYLQKQTNDKEDNLMAMLQEQIGLLLQQVDRFKRRVHETSDELVKLEREREQAFKILRSQTETQTLPEVVRDRLEQERDQQELLRGAIEELRNQVATARSEKKELGKQLETACQQSPKESRRANGEVVSSARTRRKSLPSRPTTAKGKHNVLSHAHAHAHAHVHEAEECRRRSGSASSVV